MSKPTGSVGMHTHDDRLDATGRAHATRGSAAAAATPPPPPATPVAAIVAPCCRGSGMDEAPSAQRSHCRCPPKEWCPALCLTVGQQCTLDHRPHPLTAAGECSQRQAPFASGSAPRSTPCRSVSHAGCVLHLLAGRLAPGGKAAGLLACLLICRLCMPAFKPPLLWLASAGRQADGHDRLAGEPPAGW